MSFLAAAAGSTVLTVLAALVAGNRADEVVSPAGISARVILILAAPCVGALLPGALLARRATPAIRWAIGLGAPVGPLLAFRLQQMQSLGEGATVATIALLLAWVLGTWLVSGLVLRGSGPAER